MTTLVEIFLFPTRRGVFRTSPLKKFSDLRKGLVKTCNGVKGGSLGN